MEEILLKVLKMSSCKGENILKNYSLQNWLNGVENEKNYVQKNFKNKWYENWDWNKIFRFVKI